MQGFYGSFDEQYDVAVIGCGAAGLAAAVSAADAASDAASDGLAIAVLERAPKEQRGGNTRWTGAYMRLKDTSTVADRFVEDMLEFSRGLSDERYVRTLAEKAPETIGWVQSKGVEFDRLPTIFLTARQRLLPLGGGAAIVETLARHVEVRGIPILYETTAQRLIMGDDGSLCGLEVRDSNGRLRRLRAKTIIIASGGFEGNPQMMEEHIGPGGNELATIAPGGQYNKGDGIRMALEVGAKAAGQWEMFHAENVDPRSWKPEAVVMTYPYGVLVNKGGERFLDEGAETVEESFERVSLEIFRQEDNVAYSITDQKLLRIPEVGRALGTDKEPYAANTIAELAKEIGADSNALERTISTYNEAVPEDASRFDPFKLDGLAARKGLTPPKSNWALPIDEPPYLAYPVACSNVFTFGGVATNERAEVIAEDGTPIPGLYAAGEVTGLYYHKYPGATSVLRSLVFGKVAGDQAARYVSQGKAFEGAGFRDQELN